MGRTTGWMLVAGFVSAVVASSAVAAEEIKISQTFSFGSCKTVKTADGDELVVPGLGNLLVPGKPKLPSRIYSVAIPPGATITYVTVDLGEGVTFPETYRIRPAPLPRVIGEEDPVVAAAERERYEANFAAAYQSDDSYPEQVAELVRPAGYRNYNIADVRVTPFRYRPLSGQLTFYPDVAVHVHCTLPARAAAAFNDLPRAEDFARKLIVNYDEAQQWYAPNRSKDRGLHDFVIITLDSLTSSVTPLVTWETSKGRTVSVVTTTWISSNYTGYDLAEKMRNFLRDKYPSAQWGIQDVLLVGDYTNVPMRLVEQDLGYGKPKTDYYYADLSLPDSQSWDSDGDHLYGDDTDPVDFYAEVNVGRIPWGTAATVQSICQKSVAYEQNTNSSFKKNMLLLGGYFWEDTDNAELMEAKIDQTWMAGWTFTRMYEQNSTVYSTFPCNYELTHANVMSVWPSGTYAFVNWAGHGSPTSAHIMGYSSQAFITSSDCSSLNDSYPAIIFADACSNSDTAQVNIGQSMMQRGAVGFVGATKVALGCPAWNDPYDGSSQSMDYFFTTAVTSGQYTMGEAHQYALTQMYVNGLWGSVKYEACEWGALWGNPDLRMAPASGIKVSPLSVLEASGSVGGPFTPDSQTYTVKNMGPGSISYNVTSSQSWVTVTDGSGTLANVGDTATVTVSINSGANVLGNGLHTSTIDFVNTTDHIGDTTRKVQLAIGDNDLCSGAFEACNYITYTGTTSYAANDGSASCGTSTTSPDVWFKYVPATGGTAKFSLCDGTAYDSVLSVHSGCPGTTSNQLGCDDDYCGGGGPSQVSLTVTAGNTYMIRVTGWNGSTGSYALYIDGPDCIPSATCNDGVQNQGETRIDCGGPCPPCDCASDASCDDAAFCNGEEWCDTYGHCQNGSVPCPGEECRESVDICCDAVNADGDMNGSGVADGDDIQQFVVAAIGQTTAPAQVCPGDFTGDGIVNLADVSGMVNALLAN